MGRDLDLPAQLAAGGQVQFPTDIKQLGKITPVAGTASMA